MKSYKPSYNIFRLVIEIICLKKMVPSLSTTIKLLLISTPSHHKLALLQLVYLETRLFEIYI